MSVNTLRLRQNGRHLADDVDAMAFVIDTKVFPLKKVFLGHLIIDEAFVWDGFVLHGFIMSFL